MSYATLVGITVIRDSTGAGVYYTPPIVREALEATFSLETTHFICGGSIVVTVEHKDFADTSWATADTFASITATGVETLTISALKEEIRFKLGFSGAGPAEFAHMVVAEPTWLHVQRHREPRCLLPRVHPAARVAALHIEPMQSEELAT